MKQILIVVSKDFIKAANELAWMNAFCNVDKFTTDLSQLQSALSCVYAFFRNACLYTEEDLILLRALMESCKIPALI